MVTKGYVSSLREAAEIYLNEGKLAFVPVKRFFPREAIELVKASGGVPILAHPSRLRLSKNDAQRFLERLKGFGLAGIESGYFAHSKQEIKFGGARRGGSD
jgi:hypothetical protein